MTDASRRKTFFLLLLTLLCVLLLASSLSNMQLQPGLPFPTGSGEEKGGAATTGGNLTEKLLPTFIQGLAALAFILLLFYIAYNFIFHFNWKQNLPLIILLAFLLILVMALPGTLAGEPDAGAGEIAAAPSEAMPVIETSLLGAPPATLIWVIFIALILCISAAGVWWFSRRPDPGQEDNQVLQEAQNAVAALQSGQAFKDVMIQCYTQMSRVLQEEQGLKRGQAMTAREFEQSLAASGIPQQPVHQLTLLFEAARYSDQPLGQEEEQTGLECLAAIIRHCQSVKDPRA